MDAGTGQNIVELIDEDALPKAVGLVRRIGEQPAGQHGQQLQIHHVQLRLTVGTLVPGHGSIGAAMVFEVQLAFPQGQAAVVLHPLAKLVKIGAGKGLTHPGKAGHAVFHSVGGFQHGAGRAAAAVAVAVGDQNVVVDVLILVALPAADDSIGMKHAVVGGEEALLFVLPNAQRGDQMGQNLRTVDAAPAEGVVGHLVKLVPGQLGGHEVFDAAFLHDLGQGSGIAKHVRQPEDAVFHAEFVPEEALAVEELPHQTFAAGQVAVRFYPHAAFRLPAALPHPLLQARVQLGIALLEEGVQLGLAGHEAVVGIFVHQLEHRGKAAGDLFPGLGHRPPPGHVDVGVADAGGDNVIMAAQLLVEMLLQIGPGLVNALLKGGGIGCAEIQQVDRVVHDPFQIHAAPAFGLQPGERLQGHLQIPVQALDLRVDLPEFHDQVELGMQGAGVSLQLQTEGLARLGAAAQQHVPVVHVDALHDLAVDK